MKKITRIPRIKAYQVIFILLLVLFLAPSSPADSSKTYDPDGWRVWGDAYWPTAPVNGGVARAAAPVYIGLMNPNHFPVLDWFSMSFMYEKLINLDARQKPTMPWLAESWEYMDNVTVLMKLRQGVHFHDGTLFNAESLKYQMEWILDKKNRAWTRTWLEPLESVEIVDEYTVKWHFKRPWGAFLGTMASVPGFMISKKALVADSAMTESKRLQQLIVSAKRKLKKAEDGHDKAEDSDSATKDAAKKKVLQAKNYLKELEKKEKEATELAKDARPLDSHPVGTGQFTLEAASHGNYIQLKRNPNWWFGRSIGYPEMPYFEGIRVSVIPDPSVRLANLKAGKLDFIILNPRQYRLVENNPKIDVSVYPFNMLVFLSLNHANGPCRDIRIRKAISHAIDREALVMGTQFGKARIATCIYPEDHWAYNPNLKPVNYNPELSKKLLAEAGYPNGLTLKGFSLNIPEAQTFSKAVMGMLEKVGITWKPVFLGITGMAEPFQKKDFDIVGSIYPMVQEPDHIASLLYKPDSFFNNGRSRNEKAIELIEAGRREVEYEKRKEIYFDLQKALHENYEDVWLFYPHSMMATNKNFQGFNVDLFKKYGEGYYFSHPMWFKEGHP
jgi:peptide/nickel transport system substrate-binding protein